MEKRNGDYDNFEGRDFDDHGGNSLLEGDDDDGNDDGHYEDNDVGGDYH